MEMNNKWTIAYSNSINNIAWNQRIKLINDTIYCAKNKGKWNVYKIGNGLILHEKFEKISFLEQDNNLIIIGLNKKISHFFIFNQNEMLNTFSVNAEIVDYNHQYFVGINKNGYLLVDLNQNIIRLKDKNLFPWLTRCNNIFYTEDTGFHFYKIHNSSNILEISAFD